MTPAMGQPFSKASWDRVNLVSEFKITGWRIENPNECWVFHERRLTGRSFLSPSSLQVNLRATDARLMRQLLVINESIESIKWMIEEKATITSRGSSLSGSLCSLLESQSTSLHGSYNSLHDGSDGLDGISVGSYLDTLADDVPGHHTPSDLDQFSDSSVTEDSQALRKPPKLDSEYYCFGWWPRFFAWD